MGCFGKLWRKAKQKKSSKRELSAFNTIDSKFERIRPKLRVKNLMSTNSKGVNMNLPSAAIGAISSPALHGEASGIFSVFTETFLQDKHLDCLEQVLSFLQCKELLASATTCKALQHIIFANSDQDCDVNRIWEGAEMELVNPHDRLSYLAFGRTVGANARDFCRLFVVASTAAEAFDDSAYNEEIDEDHVQVDDLLVNLLNVRGFDAEGIAELKEMAETFARSDDSEDEDEESGEIEIVEIDGDDDSEQDRALAEQVEERATRFAERCEMLQKLTPPEKTYHHKVFVRITRTRYRKLVCQGFCGHRQKLPWNVGLELTFPDRPQGLNILLDFEALSNSLEVESYLDPDLLDIDGEERLDFRVTAVSVNEKDGSCQCLFQQDLSTGLNLVSERDFVMNDREFKKHTFELAPTWGRDTIQLGPSPYSDQYFLDYTFSLGVGETSSGEPLVLPFLEVDVQKDTSLLLNAVLRQFGSDALAEELSDRLSFAAFGGIGILRL